MNVRFWTRIRMLGGAILLSAAAHAADGVNVTATVDRNQVGVGDVINLTVSVTAQDSTNVNPPQVPPLSGFDVINTSSGMETRSTFVNGRFMTEQSRSFTYMLAITQKGALSIPPIAVTVDGQTYKTQPIQISATGARSAPPQARQQQAPTDPFDQMDEMEELFNQMIQRRLQPRGAPGGGGQVPSGPSGQVNPDEAFFIHAEADKQKAFVGEQITVSFYLYTRGNIRDIDTLKYPDLRGFWKEEIEMATRLNFEQAVVNGLSYSRALLVSYALFPIKPGKATIDSYKAKCTVVTPANFGFGRPYVFTKASKPIAIEVIDVPENGRPANYSGAVGHFRVNAAFEPPTGTVNQPVTLRVRFEGQGNAKLIELPKLELPPSFELYDQKSQAKFMKDGTSFKEFEVLVIPREPGVFKIPAISTAVFDPQSQKFTAISSQPLNLAVTGSATPGAPAAAPVAGGGSKGEAASGEPTLPALATDLDGPALSARTLATTTAGLYVLVFAFLGVQGWTQLRRKPKRANLGLILKNRIKAIRALSAKGEWRKVGVQSTNAIYYILGQISDQGGASQELGRLLEHTPPSLRDELAKPLEKLVAQCEALSFAPEAMIGDLNQKPKLNALINEVEALMTKAIHLAEI
jgi:hypothetical protein